MLAERDAIIETLTLKATMVPSSSKSTPIRPHALAAGVAAYTALLVAATETLGFQFFREPGYASLSGSKSSLVATFVVAFGTPLMLGLYLGYRRQPATRLSIILLGIMLGVGIVAGETLSRLFTTFVSELNEVFTFRGGMGRLSVIDVLDKLRWFSHIQLLALFIPAATLEAAAGIAVGKRLGRRAAPSPDTNLDDVHSLRLKSRHPRIERLARFVSLMAPLLAFIAALIGSVLSFVGTLLVGSK